MTEPPVKRKKNAHAYFLLLHSGEPSGKATCCCLFVFVTEKYIGKAENLMSWHNFAGGDVSS